MATEIKIEGIEEASRKLKSLSDVKTAKSIARKAARKAMNKVRDRARQNAQAIDDPETSARIYKNIATYAGRMTGNAIKMRVGVRGGASSNQYSKDISGLSGGNTRHWRFIELGTKFDTPVPFMRPAFYPYLEEIGTDFCNEFSANVTALVNSK